MNKDGDLNLNILKLGECRIQSPMSGAKFVNGAEHVLYHDDLGEIKALLDAGKTLAVPKIVDSDFMEAETFSSWEDLVPGELGILTPGNSKPCSGPFDVALTPGLGFTLSGHRMGFGRCYYDKWFAQNKVSHKIALAYEAQLVEDIPVEDTDVPMEKIVTEQRVITI